jgi:hypothetical protein
MNKEKYKFSFDIPPEGYFLCLGTKKVPKKNPRDFREPELSIAMKV